MASKTAAMADNNFPQARRNLLLTLKDSVKKLIPFTHKGIGKLLLNEDEQKCLKLTETIEMCLFFGMKVNEFHGSIPFYGLLSKIISNPVTTIQMQNSVDITSSSSSGRTVLARSRTWIRYALNFQILDELVEQIKNQKYELLQHFYYDRALLLSVDDLNIFIAILRSLKVLKFCFNLNSPELSMIPNWMGSSYNPSISLQPKLRGHNSDSLLTFIQKDFMDIFFTSTKTVDDENADSSYELGATGALLSLSRQMEVLGNRRPLFGTHLKDLLLDDWRCAHAYLEPRLGVPNQILKLIHFISRRLDTPGLFRKRCSNNEAMIRLRMYLEMEKGIPNGVDIYTAVQCLIQWLCELPEPLLGFQHYEALHSCYQNLNELEHRVRNVSLLVNESPWYSQPTTCQILSLFSQAIQAKHSESNKLTLSAISYIVAPTLLRVDGLTSMKSSRRQVSNDQSSNNNATRTVYEFSKSLLINSSICSPIAGFMIENEVLILDSVRSHLSEVHRNLKDKCQKILRLQNDIVKSLPKFWIGNTESVADIEGTIEDDAFESIKALWLKLEPVESRRLNTYVATTPNGSDYRVDTALQTVTRSDILRHPRWDICGFPQDAPLSNFQKYGWMMLQCLIHAVTFYEGRVHSILIEFAQKRRRYCSVCQVSTALIQFLSEFLMLISPNSETLPQIQQMSRRKSWKFIGDDHVFEELFVMGLLTYDDSWKRLTDRLSQLPHSDTHSLCLEYTIKVITDIVNQRPRNLEKLWEYWTKHRLSTQLKDDTQNVPDSEPTSDAIIRRESSSVDSNGGPAFIVKVLDGDFKSIVEKATSHDTVLNEDGKFSFQSPQKLSAKDVGDITFKTFSGIETQVKGSSHILSQSQVDQLESGLPRDYQCNNWRLLYRLTKDGADLSTLVRKAKGLDTFLLILKDLSGGVFGALVPETKFSFEGDKYYGNGLVCVWTFVSGVFALYSASNGNNYYMLTSDKGLGFGGGGNFALFVDGDLNTGSTGPCDTFASPALTSVNPFTCVECELYVIESPYT